MNVNLLDPYVATILKEHGWSEDRVFDIDNWVNILTKEGYVIFDYATEILANLGGLAFDIKHVEGHMGAQFNFDALDAGSGEFDRMEWYEELSGEHLFPIGLFFEGFAYVGESKKIYGGSAEHLYRLGNSVEDYLNRLFDETPSAKPILLEKGNQP